MEINETLREFVYRKANEWAEQYKAQFEEKYKVPFDQPKEEPAFWKTEKYTLADLLLPKEN